MTGYERAVCVDSYHTQGAQRDRAEQSRREQERNSQLGEIVERMERLERQLARIADAVELIIPERERGGLS